MGGTTDSGGEGTKHSLKRGLEKVGVSLSEDYHVGACCLHNIQTALRNAAGGWLVFRPHC